MSAYHNGQLPPGPWRGPGRTPDEGPSFLQAGGGLGGSPPVGGGQRPPCPCSVSSAFTKYLRSTGTFKITAELVKLQNQFAK